MGRRITVLLLIIATLLTLSSCSQRWFDMHNKYPDLFERVEIISDEEGGYHVEYDGTRYDVDTSGLFMVRENLNEIPEEDVLVSWYCFPFFISYLDLYYSYTADDPIFIYMSRINKVYLREDYDYLTDTFSIEGTDHQFVFSDMLTPSSAFSYSVANSYPYEIYITLYSATCPRLQVSMRIFCLSGTWFAGGVQSNKALFEVSDEFLELLNINN